MLGIGGRRNVADEHDALLSTEETAATSTTTTVREGILNPHAGRELLRLEIVHLAAFHEPSSENHWVSCRSKRSPGNRFLTRRAGSRDVVYSVSV